MLTLNSLCFSSIPGEYIALYQSQRAILKQRHQEKEEYISRLAQDKEEMKARNVFCSRADLGSTCTGQTFTCCSSASFEGANFVTEAGLQTAVFVVTGMHTSHRLSLTLLQIKLLELQDLVMRLVRERNEWYSKYVAAAQNPELLASQNESALPVERRIELNATDGEGKLQLGHSL